MSMCPGRIPRKFRNDVVRVACNRDDAVTIEQIAANFGVHPMTPAPRMRQADVVECVKPDSTWQLVC